MKFEYTINSDGKDVTDVEEDFCAAREPEDSEVVKISNDQNGTTQIQANKEGWIYLAKICVEMAYCADKDPYYHFHRTEKFEIMDQKLKEAIGFFILDPAGADD